MNKTQENKKLACLTSVATRIDDCTLILQLATLWSTSSEYHDARKQLCNDDGHCLNTHVQTIAAQLMDTDEVELDFDQIQAKRPSCRDSVMPWNQERVRGRYPYYN